MGLRESRSVTASARMLTCWIFLSLRSKGHSFDGDRKEEGPSSLSLRENQNAVNPRESFCSPVHQTSGSPCSPGGLREVIRSVFPISPHLTSFSSDEFMYIDLANLHFPSDYGYQPDEKQP